MNPGTIPIIFCKCLQNKDLQLLHPSSTTRNPVDVAVAAILRPRPDATPNPLGSADHPHEILITKRLTNTFYPGFWELPGGKLEPGESPDAAAVREVREELGVTIRVERVLDPIEHEYEHARVRLFTCVGTLEDPTAPVRHLQVAAHRWCDLNALPWEEFLPANVRVVRAIARYLGVPG